MRRRNGGTGTGRQYGKGDAERHRASRAAKSGANGASRTGWSPAPGRGPAGRNAAGQELQEIMDANAVLGDPAKRTAYDRQRQKTTPPPRDPGPSGPDLIIGPLQRGSSNIPAPGRHLLGWIQF